MSEVKIKFEADGLHFHYPTEAAAKAMLTPEVEAGGVFVRQGNIIIMKTPRADSSVPPTKGQAACD